MVTLVWNRLVFGVRLEVESWPLFVLGVLAATVTIAMLGFLLSVVAVRYRTAWALGASLEYPGLAALRVRRTDRAAAGRGSTRSPTRWRRPGPSRRCARPPPERARGASSASVSHWVRRTQRWPAYLGVRLIDSARRNATLALT